jgi:hypothetical protein
MADLEQRVGELTDQIERLVTTLQGNSSGAVPSSGGPTRGGSATGEGVSNSTQMMAKAMDSAAPTITSSANNLAAVIDSSGKGFGDGMRNLAAPMQEGVNTFRDLSKSGIEFGGSLFEAKNQAAAAGLSLNDYSKTVTENSASLALGFGTATEGAEGFANTNRKVMKQAGEDFANMGFSMGEISEYSASYIEQMVRNGEAQNMTTQQLANGSIKYQNELDRLSKATGVSRQLLDEANKAQQADVKLRLAMQNMSVDERNAINARMEQLKQLDPSGKLAQGFSDLIAGGGVALTKEAQQVTLAMNKAGVDIQGVTRDIYNGVEGSSKKLDAALTQAGKASGELSEGDRRIATAQLVRGEDTPMATIARFSGLGDLEKGMQTVDQERSRAALAGEQEATTYKPSREALVFDQQMVKAQNAISQSLIESGVFEVTGTGLKELGDNSVIAANKIFKIATSSDGAVTSLDQLSSKFNNFSNTFENVITSQVKGDNASPEDIAAATKASEIAAEVANENAKTEAARASALAKQLDSVTTAPNVDLTPKETTTTATPVTPDIDGFIEGVKERANETRADTVKRELQESSNQEPSTVIDNIGKSIDKILGNDKPAEPAKPAEPKAEKTSAVSMPDAKSLAAINTSNSKLDTLKTDLAASNAQFKDVQSAMTPAKFEQALASIAPQTDTKVTEAPVQLASSDATLDALNQLNSNIGRLVQNSTEANDYLKNTSKNTRHSSGSFV